MSAPISQSCLARVLFNGIKDVIEHNVQRIAVLSHPRTVIILGYSSINYGAGIALIIYWKYRVNSNFVQTWNNHLILTMCGSFAN